MGLEGDALPFSEAEPDGHQGANLQAESMEDWCHMGVSQNGVNWYTFQMAFF